MFARKIGRRNSCHLQGGGEMNLTKEYIKECNHDWEREMKWFIPNFWGELIGEKKKLVPMDENKGDVRYLVCKKCGARALYFIGSDMMFIQEDGND